MLYVINVSYVTLSTDFSTNCALNFLWIVFPSVFGNTLDKAFRKNLWFFLRFLYHILSTLERYSASRVRIFTNDSRIYSFV